jgi:hypothetical protein
MKVCFLIIYFLCALNPSQAAINYTGLDDTYARCLDGTLSGYYYEPSKDHSDNSNRWVFYLQGGGECDREDSCKYQLNTALGSSKYFPTSYSDSSSWYFASGYCANNPNFCGWNHVNVPYCSQDLHSGTVTVPTNKTWGLYFSGHLIFEAVLNDLEKKYNLLSATDIVLSGASAGGIGVYMNVDYLADRFPAARVTAATIAGYYFYATFYEGTNHTSGSGMGDFRQSPMEETYDLYQAYVDESCESAYLASGAHPSACMFGNYSIPYLKSDLYAVQAQTDSTVLTGHDQFPDKYKYYIEEQAFMKNWSYNMSVALSPIFSPLSSESRRQGAFSAACYIHGDFSHSRPLIEGISYIQAFSNFYFNYSSPSEYLLADTCGIMCNPTCPS